MAALDFTLRLQSTVIELKNKMLKEIFVNLVF